jgi:carboxyl-terminal processing protease
VDHNPEFQYVRDQMASLEAVRNKTEVSLNWKTRKQEKEDLEQKRLQIENKRRTAKGEKPFKDIEQLKAEMESESDEETAAAGKHGIEIDYELTETGHVLADFIELHLLQTRMAAQ